MDYLIAFLEGVISFISPCLLPMLPIYISYFAVQDSAGKKSTVLNSVSFVIGFSVMFTMLGAFAGAIGGFLREYRDFINIISGFIVILFGLNFIGILKIPILSTNRNLKFNTLNMDFISSFLFGVIFSVCWTPCVGAFLGSALMLAASSGGGLKGILLLLSFSAGLGIPFIASAVLIDKLKSAFTFIKNNYRVINFVSGGFLILIGLLMATGLLGYFLSLLTF